MIFKRFFDSKLAQASYLVGCPSTKEALIIDPNRSIDQYLRAAAEEKLRIAHVTETHIHADFVSGTREWVNLPAKPQLDRNGQPRTDINGKPLYTSIVEWGDRDLRDRFSEAVIGAIREAGHHIGGAQ